MWCPISFEFQPHAHCIVGKNSGITQSEIKHKQTAIFEPLADSCMWNERWTYRLFSKSALRAIRRKLHLLMIHMVPGHVGATQPMQDRK